jgi:hypothetical protein
VPWRVPNRAAAGRLAVDQGAARATPRCTTSAGRASAPKPRAGPRGVLAWPVQRVDPGRTTRAGQTGGPPDALIAWVSTLRPSALVISAVCLPFMLDTSPHCTCRLAASWALSRGVCEQPSRPCRLIRPALQEL